MCDRYMRDLLRISVAQICQTIGYNATQTTPLELLQDILHTFLQEFSRDLRRQVENYNRLEATWNDTYLTLHTLNINIDELVNYMNNVEPVQFAVDVPKFPVQRVANLNFLKPGSREVLTRPVHIYEHLPPILSPEPPISPQLLNTNTNPVLPVLQLETAGAENMPIEEEGFREVSLIKEKISVQNENSLIGFTCVNKRNAEEEYASRFLRPLSRNSNRLDGEGRPTRELSSVVMTTGGFISPAIEGKLPEMMIPYIKGVDSPADTTRKQLNVSTDHANDRTLNTIIKTENNEYSTTASSQMKTQKNCDKKSSSLTERKLTGSISSLRATNKTDGVVTTSSNKKRNVPSQHAAMHFPQQSPTIASRLLKKAKKKSSNFPYAGQGRIPRADFPVSLIDTNINSVNSVDHNKSQKKCRKMLHKLTKSSKRNCIDVANLNLGKLTDIINPVKVGADRFKMEKLLKKQIKQRQKLLKQPIISDLQNRPAVDAMLLPQTEDVISAGCYFSNKNSTLFEENTLIIKGEQQIMGLKATESSLSPPKLMHPNLLSPSHSIDSVQVSRVGMSGGMSKSPGPAIKNELQPVPFATNLLEKATSVEIKLSTEPDRSKLNIFKKISKQKGSKPVSPNVSRISPIPIYTSSDNPVINLPSGTTITPTPLAIHLQHSVVSITNDIVGSDRNGNGLDRTPPCGPVGPPASVFASTNENIVNSGLEKKPKKRGRKPGSKNHVKGTALVSFLSDSNSASLKKTKKLKQQKDICEPNFLLPVQDDMGLQPLNLTNSNQLGTSCDLTTNYSMNLSNSFTTKKQLIFPPVVKERKERKKIKTKNLSFEPNNSKTNLNVPTTEEVNSINKKLMRMDTVLKPAPAILSGTSKDFSKTLLESTKDILLSPTKMFPSAKLSGGRKRSQQQNSTQSFTANMGTTYTGHRGTGYSNLTTNILPMLPLYPFPPRPGLIPGPGLYPSSGLGNFSANSANVSATSMLIPKILPFPNLKTSSIGKMPISELDRNENQSKLVLQTTDRNYCNVAPLVPDYMQLQSQCRKPEAEKCVFTDLCMKTQNDRKSSTSTEGVSEIFLKLDKSSSSDCSRLNKPPPAAITPGVMLPFGTLSCKTPSRSEEVHSLGILDCLNSSQPLENANSIGKNVCITSNIETFGNIDDPIEVSDDSNDTTTVPSVAIKSKANQSLIKPAIIAPIVSLVEEFFPLNKPVTTGTSDTVEFEMKKLKKSNKFVKKNNFTSHLASSIPVDIFGVEKSGVGKLAGGADLIPIPGTGLAYSSKTVPSTSLTATPMSTIPVSKAPPSVFNTITITPTVTSSDTQKKRKEHKKLKKLKDGRIKKKKDKKDKTKSREYGDKYMQKNEKVVREKDIEKYKGKDLFKKLKKEKKKEKQRIPLTVMSSVTTSTLSRGESIVLSASACNTNRDKLSIVPQSSSTDISIDSSATTSASQSMVPKLMLKIHSCQSPTSLDNIMQKVIPTYNQIAFNERLKREPSPELARISPLVTRPPKQKLFINDVVSAHPKAIGLSAAPNSNYMESVNEVRKSIATFNKTTSAQVILPPPSPWLSGATLTASSVLLPQQLLQSTQEQPVASSVEAAQPSSSCRVNTDSEGPVPLISENNRPSSYIDAEGNRIWICPACGKVDDGSPMIGCDGCDAWYHWICVGIVVVPKDNEDWFCRVCITRRKGIQGGQGIDKKRKRNKKK